MFQNVWFKQIVCSLFRFLVSSFVSKSIKMNFDFQWKISKIAHVRFHFLFVTIHIVQIEWAIYHIWAWMTHIDFQKTCKHSFCPWILINKWINAELLLIWIASKNRDMRSMRSILSCEGAMSWNPTQFFIIFTKWEVLLRVRNSHFVKSLIEWIFKRPTKRFASFLTRFCLYLYCNSFDSSTDLQWLSIVASSNCSSSSHVIFIWSLILCQLIPAIVGMLEVEIDQTEHAIVILDKS